MWMGKVGEGEGRAILAHQLIRERSSNYCTYQVDYTWYDEHKANFERVKSKLG